jgi:hypothetical protein
VDQRYPRQDDGWGAAQLGRCGYGADAAHGLR